VETRDRKGTYVMRATSKDTLTALMHNGVRVLNPETVRVGPEVDPDRISPDGVTIHPGCRISGAETLIMAGTEIGREGPVTLEDCQLGPKVTLAGGYFRGAAFLEGASFGANGHVREGTILEEEANAAHAVGLKQTILFPFVTLGSLINFCDLLMSGGTSRKNHSEVGSSYIHFNYTPNQDKATPSLIGDVPRGVMLNQNPIFLGGQGGMIGPCRLGFGAVVAAGTIFRSDCPEGGKLIFGGPRKSGRRDFHPDIYHSIQRRMVKNIIYIGNLCALRQWYLHVRSLFFRGDPLSQALFHGVVNKLDLALAERIKRLGSVAAKMPGSIEGHRELTGEKGSLEGVPAQQQEFHDTWPNIEQVLQSAREEAGDGARRDSFLEQLGRGGEKSGDTYVAAIQRLDPASSEMGSDWLQGIVEKITRNVLDLLPSF